MDDIDYLTGFLSKELWISQTKRKLQTCFIHYLCTTLVVFSTILKMRLGRTQLFKQQKDGAWIAWIPTDHCKIIKLQLCTIITQCKALWELRFHLHLILLLPIPMRAGLALIEHILFRLHLLVPPV